MEKDEAYTMFISADELEDDDDRRRAEALAEADHVYSDKNLREQKVTTDEILVDFKALQQELQMKDFTAEIEAQSLYREKPDEATASIVADQTVDEENPATIEVSTGEIALIKKEHIRPDYKRRRIKIVLVSIIVILLVATGALAGTYFLFFKQTTVDIFKQIHIHAEGVNGKGIIVIDPKTTAERLSRVIRELQFNYSKIDGSLSNGDVVTISIDEHQPILKSARIVPAKIMYKYIVTGLVTVPPSYDDIKNKDVLINNANTQVERDLTSYRSILVKAAKEQRQVDLDFNINYELLETWYTVDPFATSCTTNERRETCASVAYVYRIHAAADSTSYYITEPDDYLIIEYTGIHYDSSNTLKYKLVDIRTEETKEKTTKFLVEAGFNLVETKAKDTVVVPPETGTPTPPTRVSSTTNNNTTDVPLANQLAAS